jgi:DNA-binding response OmpR family regulator
MRGFSSELTRTSSDTLAVARAAWRSDDAHDLVLLDVMLPDGDGLALLWERRAAGDLTPTVLLTAREEAELGGRAADAGADAYLPKPFAYRDLDRAPPEGSLRRTVTTPSDQAPPEAPLRRTVTTPSDQGSLRAGVTRPSHAVCRR